MFIISRKLWKVSLNTVHGCIQKCELKLYPTRRKPYISSVQNHGPVLWTPAHLRWTERQWTRVLWSDESTFQLLLEILTEKLHLCEGAIDAEVDVGGLERQMLPSR